jgi:hypothetical protein
MRKLVVSALAAALIVVAAPVASAHAPCDHRTHSDWSWRHFRYETIQYQRSVSLDRYTYRDVYRNLATGETIWSGVCP